MILERTGWISNVRVFALVGIVLLHVACVISKDEFSTNPSLTWWIGNMYDSMVRCCVPLFVMITGALFLSREIELKSFFRKRFIRILIPFLFWSFIYVSREAFHLSWRKGTNFLTSFWHLDFIAKLFKGEIMFHFWYVYMLIGLLLFIPILNQWIRHSTEKEILYFLSIWLITLIIRYNFIGNRLNESLKLIYFSGYIGYLVLGYYLANAEKYKISSLSSNRLFKKISDNKPLITSKFLTVILILTAFLITIFGTYYVSIRKGVICQDIFYEYLTINVLMAAIGIFLFIKSFNVNNKVFIRIINFLDKYSYGIYLIHVLVLIYLDRFGINAYFTFPLISIPSVTILCVGISVGIIYIVNKLPYIGKYISG